MPKVTIDLPQQWLFQTELTLRVADINYGGHLGNDRVLGLAHEARVEWLRSLHLSEMDVGGAGLIMADAAIMFRGEAFLGDDLTVAIGASEVRRSGFELIYAMQRRADGQDIALVKTGLVCFDYALRKPVRIPPAFARILEPSA